MNKRCPQLFILLLAALASSSVFAAAQRTFVSTAGVDTNPCSRTQPCRNFAAAIVQTVAGGEVYVLDSGGYGPATISSSVTIQAEGVTAGITVFSGDGIDITATPADVVTLRGIAINGLGGNHGISFQTGGALHLDRMTASNMLGNGIDMTASGQMFVDDCTMRDNRSNMGLRVHPSSGSAFVSVESSHFDFNHHGVWSDSGATVVVRNSAASGNSGTGFNASGGASVATVFLDTCVAAHNGFGIVAQGTGQNPGSVTISNVTVYANTTGMAVAGSGLQVFGSITSFGNNSVDGNTNNGLPSATAAPV